MLFSWSSKLAVLAALLAIGVLIAEAGRVKLRPLKPDEVYSLLKKAGREDAVPEGRVVTQAISAISGFGLGVASGVGGAITYDLITQPNETMTWLNGLFGMNGGSTAGSSSEPKTQEICFKTRSMDYDYDVVGRQTGTTGTTGTSPTGTATPTTPTTMTATTGAASDTTCIVIEKARHRRRREAIIQQLEERYKHLILE